MLRTTSVESIVRTEIQTLLTEAGNDPTGVSLDEALHEVGLDSLGLARLMIALEAELGIDPFTADTDDAELVDIFDVHTVGALVEVYTAALDRTESQAA